MKSIHYSFKKFSKEQRQEQLRMQSVQKVVILAVGQTLLFGLVIWLLAKISNFMERKPREILINMLFFFVIISCFNLYERQRVKR